MHEILINNMNNIPGQLGKQIERTFSRNCNSLRDVLKVSVFSYSVLVKILLSCISTVNSVVFTGAAALHTQMILRLHISTTEQRLVTG